MQLFLKCLRLNRSVLLKITLIQLVKETDILILCIFLTLPSSILRSDIRNSTENSIEPICTSDSEKEKEKEGGSST